MKKFTAFFSALVLLLTCGVLPAASAAPQRPGTVEVQFFDEAAGQYGDPIQTPQVNVELNGEPLVFDVPALTRTIDGVDGRTLVPVRPIAEALGATVLWIADNRQALILTDQDTIVLTLGSATAVVNGRQVQLPGGVPAGGAKVAGAERTLVPLRFVSEQLHAQVDWDGATYTASVTAETDPVPTDFTLSRSDFTLFTQGETFPLRVSFTPSNAQGEVTWRTNAPEVATVSGEGLVTAVGPGTATITAALPGVGERTCTVRCSFSPPPAVDVEPTQPNRGLLVRIQPDDNAQSVTLLLSQAPKYRVADLGDRVVIDLLGVTIGSGRDGSLTLENPVIQQVRYAQHTTDIDPDYARTTRVVLDLAPGCTYADHVTVTGDPDLLAVVVTVTPPDTGSLPVQPPQTSPDWDPTAFTVVLDAGHGGSAPGAVYEGIKEKDITLPITLRAAELLRERGYNVILTREEDVYMDLYDRCDVANWAGADVFLSIHCNASSTNLSFQGTFTYSYPDSVRGERLAACVQNAVVAAAGSIDRGLLVNDYVVLRETEMPAALLETGFMSCHEELMRLMRPDYQEKLAQGAAQGVADYLSTLPAKTAAPQAEETTAQDLVLEEGVLLPPEG